MVKKVKEEIPMTDMQKALLKAGLLKQKAADKSNQKEQKRKIKLAKKNEEKI